MRKRSGNTKLSQVERTFHNICPPALIKLQFEYKGMFVSAVMKSDMKSYFGSL